MEPSTWRFPQGVLAGAPCFDGHFPNDPIVPGAYLLALAEGQLTQAGWEIAFSRRIKFLSPLRPDQPFRIEAAPGSTGTILRWFREDLKIAEASVTLRATQ